LQVIIELQLQNKKMINIYRSYVTN
jgi:hypothetical protein